MTTFTMPNTAKTVLTAATCASVFDTTNKSEASTIGRRDVEARFIFDHCKLNGDYNLPKLYLNKAWAAGCYGSAKAVARYWSDHSDMGVSFDKKARTWNVKKVKDNEDKIWKALPEMSYNEYEKEQSPNIFDLEAADKRIVSLFDAIEKTEDMTGNEKNAEYTKIEALASKHLGTNLPDVATEDHTEEVAAEAVAA